MTMPATRSGRPNTSGTRGGQAQSSPLPLAEEGYSKDNEQKFRRQLMDMLLPIQQQVAGLASGLTGLLASLVANDSSVTGDDVAAALDWLLANKQPLDADLTAIAAIATTPYGRALLALADAAALRTAGGLVIGTNVEAWSANLDAWSALATSAKQNALGYTPLNAASNLSDVGNVTTSRGNLVAEQLGVIRGVNPQTGNYVLVLTDDGKSIEMNVAGANTLTVPPNSSVAFPVGAYFNFAQYGAGQTTLTPGSGVTLRSYPGLKTAGQYAAGTAYQRAVDEWIVAGALTP